MAVVCRCEDHGPSAQTLTGSYQVVMCVGRAARESDPTTDSRYNTSERTRLTISRLTRCQPNFL